MTHYMSTFCWITKFVGSKIYTICICNHLRIWETLVLAFRKDLKTVNEGHGNNLGRGDNLRELPFTTTPIWQNSSCGGDLQNWSLQEGQRHQSWDFCQSLAKIGDCSRSKSESRGDYKCQLLNMSWFESNTFSIHGIKNYLKYLSLSLSIGKCHFKMIFEVCNGLFV